jgi:hypothetical protein
VEPDNFLSTYHTVEEVSTVGVVRQAWRGGVRLGPVRPGEVGQGTAGGESNKKKGK